MAELTGYIYSITNELNGKTYIGKTNNLVRRWKEHYYGKGNTAILNNAIKKYGIEHFVFDIDAQIPFDNIEELNSVLAQLEMYYISLYGTFGKGYNATAGGDGICFYKHSEETKEKLRQLQKEKWLNPEIRNKMAMGAVGYHHTEDARNRITQALLHRDSSIYDRIANKLKGRIRDHEMIMKAAKKRRKPVLQYDLQGNFVKEWEGASCIEGFERANIEACCKGKISRSQGFIWKYKEGDNYPLKIDVPSNRSSMKRAVLQYDMSNNVIGEYSTVSKAAEIAKMSRCKLCKYLQKGGYVTSNYILKYKERR